MEKHEKIFFVLAFILLIALVSTPVFAPSGTGARFNTKTVVFYLNTTTAVVAASGAQWLNFTTSLSLPDTTITILSAYLKVDGTYDAAGTTAVTTDVYLNNTNLGKYSILRSAEAVGFEILANASRGASGSDFYSLSSTPQYNQVSILCNGQCNLFSARAVITYKYDPPAESGNAETKEIPASVEKEKNLFDNLSSNFFRLIDYFKKFFGG